MMNLIVPTEWPPFHDSNGNNEFDYVDFMPKNEMRLDLLQSVTLGFLIIKKISQRRSEHVSGSANLSGEMDLKNTGNYSTLNLFNDNGLCQRLAYKMRENEFSSGVHTQCIHLTSHY